MASEPMHGSIVQIHISAGGLPKTPIADPSIHVGKLGLTGDEHRYRMHGGPLKAVLIIAAEVVDTLVAEGWPLFYGALGENFTTRGLNHRSWRPGMHLQAGGVTIQLTKPRMPCSALHPYGRGLGKRIYDDRVKLLDAKSDHWGESGFYASVIVPGRVSLNDPIVQLPEESSTCG